MADSVIGALRVVLGLDTAAFDQGAKNAQKTAANFSKTMGGMQKELGTLRTVMTAVAAGAFGAFIKANIKAGADLQDTAERLGINVERYQELAYAAKLAGMESGEFEKALGQFNKRMGDFSTSTTEAQRALGRLGISFEDIKNLPLDEQLQRIADGFDGLDNAQEKARISNDLFGKAGQKTLLMFQGGSETLKKFADEARRIGIVLSTETLKAAGEADDEIDRIGASLKAASIQIAAGFLPALTEIRKIVTSKEFQAGVKELAKDFASLVKSMIDNKEDIAKVTAVLLAFKLGASAGSFGGPIIAGLTGIAAGTAAYIAVQEQFQKKTDQVNETIHELENNVRAVKNEMAAGAGTEQTIEELAGYEEALVAARAELKRLTDEKEKADELLGKPTKVTVNAKFDADIPNQIADLKLKIAEARGELKLFGDGFVELVKGKVPLEDLQKGFAGLSAQQKQLAQTNLELKLAEGAKAAITPYDELLLKLKEVDLQFSLLNEKQKVEGGKAAKDYAGAWQNAFVKLLQSQLTAVGQGVDGLAKGLEFLAKGNQKMAAAAKAAAILSAIINTAQAVTKTYAEYGFTPWGIVAAAGALAAGAVQIATIKAQEFAHGGSFRVGGSGGIDSQLMQFKATPGEMVDVRTPGQSPAASSGTTTEIALRGRRMSDLMSMEDLRDLIDAMNGAHRDGYKLKFVS